LWHPERKGCKNQCHDTRAAQKATNFGSANTCFGGVIRIGISDGVCVHAISPKDLMGEKAKHS
jgi:hypothetical protein